MFGPRPGDVPDEAKYLEFVARQIEDAPGKSSLVKRPIVGLKP